MPVTNNGAIAINTSTTNKHTRRTRFMSDSIHSKFRALNGQNHKTVQTEQNL
jgi:hypothetical protein